VLPKYKLWPGTVHELAGSGMTDKLHFAALSLLNAYKIFRIETL